MRSRGGHVFGDGVFAVRDEDLWEVGGVQRDVLHEDVYGGLGVRERAMPAIS